MLWVAALLASLLSLSLLFAGDFGDGTLEQIALSPHPLPALVSVTAGVVEPRYPSFKGIMAAKSKPVDQLTVADLGLDAGIVGWAGAGQEIIAVDAAPEREAGEVIEDDGEAYQKIVQFLDDLKVL